MPGKIFFQQQHDHFCQTLADLECHIANEPITDDDIGLSSKYIPALHVTHEIQRSRLQETEYLSGKFIPLNILLADGKQANLGTQIPQNGP